MSPIDETLGTPEVPDSEPDQFPGSTIRASEFPRLKGSFPGVLVSDDNGAIRPITQAEVDAGTVRSQ